MDAATQSLWSNRVSVGFPRLRRWAPLLALGCFPTACEPGWPIPGVPVDCDAYSGARVGSWRSVPYPDGVLIDSAGAGTNEFFLLGGHYCFYCQGNWLESGETDWTSTTFDDEEVWSTLSDPTPANVVITDDFIGTSDITNHDRDEEQLRRFVLLDRSGTTWKLFDPPAEYGNRGATSLYWTGSEFLLWGGVRDDADVLPDDDTFVENLADGALFDPVNETWRMAPAARPPVGFRNGDGDARFQLASTWTPDGLLVWGTNADETAPFLALYSPSDDQWTELEATGSPPLRVRHELVYGDGHVYLFSGDQPELARGPGRDEAFWDMWRLDIAKLEWQEITVPTFVDLYHPQTGVPPRPSAAWVDGTLLVSGSVCTGVAIYDPETDSWTRSSIEGGPPAGGTAYSVGGELYLNAVSYSTSQSTDTVWIFSPEG